jgi:mycothiol synthase
MRKDKGPDDLIEVPDAPPVPGLTFRRYRGEGDIPLFKAMWDGCKDADQVWWSYTLEDFELEFRHLVNCDPERDIILAEVNGQVVGYSKMQAMEELDGTITYRHHEFVLPRWRGTGIRRAILHYFDRRARRLSEERGGDGLRMLTTWVIEHDESRIELLAEEGYVPVRYFYELHRDLSKPLHDHPMPEGLEVHLVPPEDYRKVFDAANEALLDHWGARQWTDEEFQEFIESPTFEPGLWQIAYDGDEVAGNVINWINKSENEEFDRKWGYTEIISVRRPYRGRGLAKALVTRSMAVLRDRGIDYAVLGVDTDNPSGALRLYTGLGYEQYKRFYIYGKTIAGGVENEG